MVGKTNVGGGTKVFAAISVTYPSGSTCTCSDGSKTLKLKDTSGLGIFLIPYAATWTVSCTDGTKTASKAVIITTDGQSESVTLSYSYYLFKENDIAQNKMTYKQRSETATSVTVSDEFIQVTRPSGSQNFGEVQFYSEDKHDLSMYDTLYFDVSIQGVYVFEGNTTRCGVFSTEPTTSDPGTVVAVTVIESSDDRKTYTVDLTSITKSWPFYVGLGGNFVGKIYNIWAE